ncbi:MAG: LytTR family DNA-binding domain-containing protein [Desulfobacteraceae bacterium]|jgi:DNA-binding LytR/AlgR family response regulator
MSEVKAIIADDEAPLRASLRAGLSRVWPELIITGEARNGQEALELVQRHRPHIAFLDIRMPGMTGLEVAGKIAGLCRIVFVTAHDEYAVEAFEKEAVDYLLKPFSDERLLRTVARLKGQGESLPAVSTEILQKIMDTLSNPDLSSRLSFLRIQQGDGVRLLPVEEVIYFQARDKYTGVITREGESLIRKPIKELAHELDPSKFWRIHRGTIVNARFIERASRSLTGKGQVRLKERTETLPVSKRYMHLFRQM